jgi:hypothetical protein
MENNMTKEQYLAIIGSWKQYTRDGKHKRYKVDDYTHSYGTKSIVCGYHWQSNLSMYHHCLYGLIRNRDLSKVFSATSLKLIMDTLNWYAKNYDKALLHQYHLHEFMIKLLEPFGEQFTVNDYRKLFYIIDNS